MKLSTTYKTDSGDSFEDISRKKYGTEENAGLIRGSNPGLAEPITEGVAIAVPEQPGAPQDISQKAPADSLNETALMIDGKRFRFWSSVNIFRSIDSFDTISFTAPFDFEAPNFKEAFRPFTYQSAQFTVNGEPLFTGITLSPDLILGQKKTIQVSGYSSPGVLNDCTAPASAFPLEFNGQGLREISATLASYFGLTVDFQTDQGTTFERVALSPGKKILSFLTPLANQRNIIISSTEGGKLLFWKSVETGEPVATLRQGESPLMSVTPFFDPQNYYSHITGIEPSFVGVPGEQYTVKNTLLEGVVRPFTFEAPDTLESDIKAATESKAGRMFGGMVSYDIMLDTWRDPTGELWAPNTILNLEAPDAMVYSPFDFLVKSVNFERIENSETALLTLVLPGSFSGKIPETLPWAE